MERDSVTGDLLQIDSCLWRSPHTIQLAKRHEVRWDEFFKTLVNDLALGMSTDQWVEHLLVKEGNIGLAVELAVKAGSSSRMQSKIKMQEDEWQELVQVSMGDGNELLAHQAYEISEDDRNTYDEFVELAKEHIQERAYGDALAVMELAINTLRSSLEARRSAIATAFNFAEKEITKVQASFMAQHRQAFPGGEEMYDITRKLLLQASARLLFHDYISSLKISAWAQDLINGREIAKEARELLAGEEEVAISSPRPEDLPKPQPLISQSEANNESKRHWPKVDDEYLIDNYDVLTNQQLVSFFNIDESEIENRIQQLGLVHKRGSGKKVQWRNPYVAGRPLRNTKVFVGRDDVFSFIADNRQNYEEEQDRNLIVLLGHRRTGKTSILLQLRKNRKDLLEPRIPIFIDMEGLLPFPGGLRNFFWKLAIRIRAELLDQVPISIPEPREDAFKDPSWEFQQFLKNVIAELNGRGLVIMLDEFHAIEPGQSVLDINVYKMLRSVIQHNTDVDFILAGTMQMENLMRTYQAAMFGSAITKKIDFLDEQDARKLITRPVQDYITFSQEAIDMIIDVTASHPYFVQLICWTLTQYLIDRGKCKATVNDIERILSTALERGVHFDEIWATDTSELERYIMAVVGELAPDRTRWCMVSKITERLRHENQMPRNSDELDEAIFNLTNRRILKRSEDGNRVQFQVYVFGSWVSTNKPFEVVRRDIRADEATRRRKIERQSMSS